MKIHVLVTVVMAATTRSILSSDDNHSLLSRLLQGGRIGQVSVVMQTLESRPRHCKDLLDSGDSGSGLRQVYPYPGQPYHHVSVYCDHTIDGGGWTVLQRRSNNSVRQDFNVQWLQYQLGFGDLEGEFWLGLDHIHQLTSTSMQNLRIDLFDYEEGHRWAKYGFFHVGGPETNYRLTIERYSGDAGDAMEYVNGQEFTALGADHDTWSDGNCAEWYLGAWWYKAYSNSTLNGYQHEGQYKTPKYQGIFWEQWRGRWYSLRETSMMIRPTF